MADTAEEFTLPSDVDASEHEAAKNIAGLLNLGGDDEDNEEASETPDPEAEGSADEEAESEDEESDEEAESEEEEAEDEEADEEQEEPAPTAKLHKVKVDGKEVEVTTEELEKSYSFTAHLTRKSQALAEKEKAFTAHEQAVAAERARYGELLSQLEEALVSMSPEEPDWDKLREENPIEYTVKVADFQRNQRRLAGVQAERARVAQQQQEAYEKRLAAHLEAEEQKLHEAVPAWKDPKVKRKDMTRLVEYAEEKYGYSRKDLADITDHRLLLILQKAEAYDAGLAAKPAVQKRVAQVIKTSKPGSAKTLSGRDAALTRQLKRAQKTGSVEDVADLILKAGLVK